MFRKKESRQEQENAALCQEQIKEYIRGMRQLQEHNQDAVVELDQIGMSATRMDSSLTKIVDHSKEMLCTQQENGQVLQELAELVEKAAGDQQKLFQQYQHLDQSYEEQNDAIFQMIEQSKHYTNISKKLSESVHIYQNSAKVFEEETQRMKEVGHNISALALHSAIEAGRLGEGGSDYIRSAEEIRDYAMGYQQGSDALSKAASQLMEQSLQSSQEIHQLILLLKENNVILGKLVSMNDKEEKWKKSHEVENTAKQLKEMQEKVEQLKLSTQKTSQDGEGIIGEMENVGACYIQQQESTKKMENLFDSIKGILSGFL